jgi:hypothetical protein
MVDLRNYNTIYTLQKRTLLLENCSTNNKLNYYLSLSLEARLHILLAIKHYQVTLEKVIQIFMPYYHSSKFIYWQKQTSFVSRNIR